MKQQRREHQQAVLQAVWLQLSGENRRVAENYKHCLDLEFDKIPEDAAFHPACYRRFTDKLAIERAGKRMVREKEGGDETQDAARPPEAAPPSEAGPSTSGSTKSVRSRSALPMSSSGPVLPALCIICKKKNLKFVLKGGKRQREALSKAETLTAGKLQTAAETKDDHSILVHIKDKDCVALEVQYHKSCYQQYTRFLNEPARQEKDKSLPGC
ncbi:uncharacterized protein LOC132868069 [Neoarius graeffei]|uniref:uncharacterized protein LOC132868069 n=1 Tax=Neoarius graeffei TaxID=443677 RepID=UPI00298BCB20|nr:uncharacterized protein LOC132868069 [Neoarius graeffei]